eukprot:2030298-Prymnesium_polylepis.1
MTLLTPNRVIAAGGFDVSEMPGSTSSLADCTDSGGTPCVPSDREHPVRFCLNTLVHTLLQH